RYMGLGGRGHQIWPDRAGMPKDALLVCGMRDACWARAAGVEAHTTTGGVQNWPDIPSWCRKRRFTLCFDAGEEKYAQQLTNRLLDHRALAVAILPMLDGFKDLAELGEA